MGPTPAPTPAPKPVVYKPAPVIYRPAPVIYKPAPVVHKPAPVVYKPAPSYAVPTYADVEPKYHWEYNVNEDYNDFGHKEGRDYDVTTGKYFVHLPDGRVQVVTYTADHTGYHPVIEYSGEAKYPAEQPKPKYEA